MNAAQANQAGVMNWTSHPIRNRKLGMWLFILSDALTFAALLFSYVYLRRLSAVWPRPFSLSPEILFASLMTLCLLASSWTMANAVKASALGNRANLVRWLLVTIAAGSAFVVLHLTEWNRLIDEGLRLFSVPANWGTDVSPLFGAVFFTLTGFHLLHVLSGIVYLCVTAMRRKATHEAVELCGLYWQFVDVVWLILFPALYLFSMK